MAGSLEVVVKFLTDTSSVDKATGKLEGETLGKLGGFAKKAGALIGGAFAIKGLGDVIGKAEESDKASARLAQTFKNAGDATGAWSGHAEKLADSLQNSTAVDDEAIKGAEALLSTFHGLASTAGTTGGAFDRATKASVDLSKAGFGDVDAAAKALGKALNDPEKGLGALKKAGVTFTDAEKMQIAAMVKAGDTAGAYNVILGKVEGKVGGVAAKTATAGDKMSVAWDETQESIGKGALPVLEKLAPIVATLATFVQKNANWLVPLVGAVIALVAALKLWAAIQAVLDVLLNANPIGLIVLGIAALIAIIFVLAANWDSIWAGIQAAAQAVADWFAGLPAFFASVWASFAGIISAPFITAWQWVNAQWQALAAWFANLPGLIGGFFATLAATIAQPFVTGAGWIRDQFNAVLDFFRGLPGRIANAAAGMWDGIKDAFRNTINSIIGLWNGLHIPSFKIGGWSTPFGDLPSFTTPQINFPDIPTLDSGGIVSSPTLAMLAANNRPEAVVPLDRLGGSVQIIVNTTGLGADAPSIQSAIVAALEHHTNRNGPLAATITGA